MHYWSKLKAYNQFFEHPNFKLGHLRFTLILLEVGYDLSLKLEEMIDVKKTICCSNACWNYGL